MTIGIAFLLTERGLCLGCVISPDEAKQTLSTQEDLKSAMIEATSQMLGEGLLIYLE